MVLTIESLDKIGCTSPNCNHKNHDNLFYFHGACHPHAQTKINYPRDWVVCVSCIKCNKFIADVAMAKRQGPPIENICHPKSGVDVSYTKGEGTLKVSCSKCLELIATIPVISEANNEAE